MKHLRQSSLAMLAVVMIALLLPGQSASAHGGFVIDSGEIENYEWAVSIFPYPVATGATVLSILLFDKSTNAPATDLSGEVYLAEPGDTRPCCEPGVARGPFLLTSDPELWPGDYTTFIPVDAAGRWQVLFKMKTPSGEYGIVTGFDAIPYGDGSQPVDKAAIATQVSIAFAAAATASAQRVAMANPLSTPQPQSPLAQSASPLAAPNTPEFSDSPLTLPIVVESNSPASVENSSAPTTINSTLLIGGGLGLVVIIGVGAMMLMGGRKEEGEAGKQGDNKEKEK